MRKPGTCRRCKQIPDVCPCRFTTAGRIRRAIGTLALLITFALAALIELCWMAGTDTTLIASLYLIPFAIVTFGVAMWFKLRP